MALLLSGLLIAGWVVMIVGWIMLLIAAFSESVLWGLACFFVPIVMLFYVIIHWSEAKKGLAVYLGGILLIIAAMVSLVVLGGPHPVH